MSRETNDGYNVLHWPEFKALMDHLNVKLGLVPTVVRTEGMTCGVSFRLNMDERVVVEERKRYHDRTDYVQHPTEFDGFALYREPEFKAFCERLGFPWRMLTISVEFRIFEGKRVEVLHTFQPDPPADLETADTVILAR